MKENNIFDCFESLDKTDWNNVYMYACQDVNNSYDTFHESFVQIYNATCRIKKIKINSVNNKPWMTHGLVNACRKKEQFISNITSWNLKISINCTRTD